MITLLEKITLSYKVTPFFLIGGLHLLKMALVWKEIALRLVVVPS